MLMTGGSSRWERLMDVRPVTIAGSLALLMFAYVAFARGLFGDGDTSWHIATGRWILANRAVPDGDPFSFSMPGTPWHAHEWLAEVPMALLFQASGWRGLALLFAGAFSLTIFLVGRELGRHFAKRWVLTTIAALVVLLLPFTLGRPHVLAWPVLAGWLLLLVHAREQGRAPPLAAALMMVAWANLHASYIVGLGLAAAFAFEALVEDRRPLETVRAWAPFGLLALAAAFVTPHGIQGFLYPLQVSGMDALAVIREWRPTRLPKDGPFVAYLVAISALALVSWRRVGWVRLLLLAGLGWMAIEHVRHQSVFVLVTMLAILPRAAMHFTGEEGCRRLEGLSRSLGALLVAGLLVIGMARLAIPRPVDPGPSNLGTAFEAVPVGVRERPVFNSYSFGGPLILRGVRPYIDGRADMYGDDFTITYNRIANGDVAAFRKADQRYGFRWTILSPRDELAEKLDREPGWHRLHADRSAIVHVKD